ncbi:hypothetical protein HY029_05990 [Candidatus Gottesmanbacteria bacterium]|nr:hypothetical protein [Candidatus Gottesmanbacteria bacterium]
MGINILKRSSISNHGQALVTLLFFMIIAITVTSGAVVIILSNSVSASKFDQGNSAYYIAESGVENALIRLLRNPNYTGETLPIDTGNATIQISGSNPITITSVGTLNNLSRTIQVTVDYTNNILTVQSWKEI